MALPMAPKRGKGAPEKAAGGKRQKTARGAAAAGKRAGAGRGRRSAAAEGGKGTCTCGECLDGWLTPQLAGALGQAASEAR